MGFLSEEIPEAECRFPVDFVVGGFSGIPDPSHALPAVSGDDGFLDLPFPFAFHPGADGSLDAYRAAFLNPESGFVCTESLELVHLYSVISYAIM